MTDFNKDMLDGLRQIASSIAVETMDKTKELGLTEVSDYLGVSILVLAYAFAAMITANYAHIKVGSSYEDYKKHCFGAIEIALEAMNQPDNTLN